MINLRTKKCPECNGNGELIEDYNDPSRPDGHGQHVQECYNCNGSGEVEITRQEREEIALSVLLEARLEQIHSEEYTGVDDDMPDDFNNWLTELVEYNPILERLLK